MTLNQDFLNWLSEEEQRKTETNPRGAQGPLAHGTPKVTPQGTYVPPHLDPEYLAKQAAAQEPKPDDPSDDTLFASSRDEEWYGERGRDGGIMGNIHEFVGQGLWGALDSVTWSTASVADTVNEMAGGEDQQLEQWVSLGAEGEWDELSGWGKAGYIVGSGLGMLPTFGIVGKGLSLASKGVGLGSKALEKKAKQKVQQFIVDEMSENVVAKSITQSIGDNVGRTVVDDLVEEGFKLNLKGAHLLSDDAIKLGFDKRLQQIGEGVSQGHLRTSLGKILRESGDSQLAKITDDQLDEITGAIFKIAKTENPANFKNAMTAMLDPILGEWGGQMAAAYLTDAVIVGMHYGVGMIGSNLTTWGYNQMYDTDIKMQHGIGDVVGGVLSHGALGGFIGPMRYVPGGKGSRIFADDINGLIRRTKKWNRPENLTDAQLDKMIELVHKTSGSESGPLLALGIIDKKFTLSNFLKTANRTKKEKFLKDAHEAFVPELNKLTRSEIFKDIQGSMGRMIAGSAAMNLPTIIDIVKHGGVEDLAYTLGTDPEEIISNLLVGFVFSKRGHKLTGKNNPYWSNLNSHTRHYAENAERIRQLEKGIGYAGFKPHQAQAFISTKDQVQLDKKVREELINDPELREILNIIDIGNKEQGSIKEIPSEGLTYKQHIDAKKAEIINDTKLTPEQQQAAIANLDRMSMMYDTLVKHADNIREGESFDVRMSAEDYAMMSKAMQNMKFNGKSIDSKKQFEKAWNEKTWEIFEKSTNDMIDHPMTAIKEIYDVFFGKGNWGTIEGNKIKIYEDILPTGALFPDFMGKTNEMRFSNTQQSFNTLIHMAMAAGLVEPMAGGQVRGKGQVNENNYQGSGKSSREYAHDIFELQSKTLMDRIYGEGWEHRGDSSASNTDPTVDMMGRVLHSESLWAGYAMYRMQRQSREADFILTGKGTGNTDPQLAKQIREGIFQTLAGKKLEFDFSESKDTQNVEALMEYAERLHKFVKLANPQIQGGPTITLTEAKIREMKDALDPFIGDVFSNKDAYNTAIRKSLDRFIESIGGENVLEFRYDVKSALARLAIDGEFGRIEGDILHFPSKEMVRDYLETTFKEGDSVIKAEIMDFYSELITAVNMSEKPGFAQFDLQVKPGDVADRRKTWEAILTEAKDAADTFNIFMIPEANSNMNRVYDVVKKVSEAALIKAEKNSDLANLYAEVMSINEALYTRFSEASHNNNVTILHALAKNNYHLVEQLKAFQTTRNPDTALGQYYIKIAKDLIREIDYNKNKPTNVDELNTHINKEVKTHDTHRATTKEAGDKPRISSQEFIAKYGLSIDFANKLREAGMSWADPFGLGSYNGNALQSMDIFFMDSRGQKFLGKKAITASVTDPKDFVQPWSEYLYDQYQASRKALETQGYDKETINHYKPEISREEIAVDLMQMIDAGKNSRRINVIEYVDGTGHTSEKMVTNWENRGIIGLFDALNLWHNAFILNKKGTIDGRQVTFTGDHLKQIDGMLESGHFTVEQGNISAILTEGARHIPPSISKKYMRLSINESTDIIVRLDSATQGKLKEAFQPGTELYEQFSSIAGGTEGWNTFTRKLGADVLTDGLIGQIIHHVGLMQAHAGYVKKMYSNKDIWSGEILYDQKEAADIWKRLKMGDAKAGIVPSASFVKDRMNFYNGFQVNGAQPLLFAEVMKHFQNVGVRADGTAELKVLTIDDGGKGKYNVYDLIKPEIEARVANGEITREMADISLEKLKAKGDKSLSDAASYVTLSPMVVLAGLSGARQSLFNFQGGEITGLNYALKPKVAHNYIDPATGAHETYYNKTAFHYDPVIASVLHTLGVDMLAFKSGNKINDYGENGREFGKNTYVNDTGELNPNKPWYSSLVEHAGGKDVLMKDGVRFDVNNASHVSTIPLESVLIKNLGTHHKPPLSASMGVHQSHNNGLAEWGNINARMARFRQVWSNIYENPYKITALGREMTSLAQFDGDIASLHSGISHYLKAGGTADAVWMRQKIEDMIVSHFLNGGNIAGAEAKQGGYDIMVPESGTFGQSFKSDLIGGGRQYIYGESQVSYAEGRQKLSLFGQEMEGSHPNVGTFVIRKIDRDMAGWDVRDAQGKPMFPEKVEIVIGRENNRDYIMVDGFELLADGSLVSRNGVGLKSAAEASGIQGDFNNLNSPSQMKARRESLYDLIIRENPLDRLNELNIENGGLTYSEGMREMFIDGLNLDPNSGMSMRPIGTDGLGRDIHVAVDPARSSFRLYVKTSADPGNWQMLTDINSMQTFKPLMTQLINNQSTWLGSVDLRMPNNGVDNVITKARGGFQIKPYKVKIRDNNGKVIDTVEHYEYSWVGNAARESGPVKKMNYTDSDRVQDADFDWDKSASYTAVHGKFLKNIAGTAGYEHIGIELKPGTIDGIIKSIIPNVDLTGKNSANSMKKIHDDLVDVNMFRGRIVKAHQSITYLLNSFGAYESNAGGIIGEFMINKGNTATVRLKDPSAQAHNINNVRNLVKEFLDYYNKYGEKPNITSKELLNSLFFGENGMFKMVDQNGNTISDFNNPKETKYDAFKDALFINVINPLNRYISLNKGDMMAGDGSTRRMNFTQFAQGYQAMLLSMNHPAIPDHILKNNGDFTTRMGRERMGNYIKESRAPFDMALREMHDIYNQDSYSNVGSKSYLPELLKTVSDGSFDGAVAKTFIDRRMNDILKYYESNQSRVVELIELDQTLRSIDRQMEDIAQFNKNYAENSKYQSLEKSRAALMETKTKLEALVSSLDKENTYRIKITPGKDNMVINRFKHPLVIKNKGETREVVMPGESYRYKKGDSGVVNGRRFVAQDGVVHRDAKANFNAFGGLATLNGREMTYDRQQGLIDPTYREFFAQYIEINNRYRDQVISSSKYANRSAEIQALLHETLYKLKDPLDRKAFIYRLLTPTVNKEVISMHNDSFTPGAHVSFDYAFKDNSAVQNLVFQYLSSRLNGQKFEHGIDKAEAQKLLDHIVTAKNMWNMRLYDPSLALSDIANTDVLTKTMDLSGRLEQSHLSLPTDFLKKIYTDKKNDTRLFQNLQGWITGEKLLNPGQLFRITEEFRRQGFMESDIFFNQRFIHDKTGQLIPAPGPTRNFGHIYRGTRIIEGTGEFGNPGTRIEKLPSEFNKEQTKKRDNC